MDRTYPSIAPSARAQLQNSQGPSHRMKRSARCTCALCAIATTYSIWDHGTDAAAFIFYSRWLVISANAPPPQQRNERQVAHCNDTLLPHLQISLLRSSVPHAPTL